MKSDKGARKRGFASGRKKEEKQAAAEQTFVFHAALTSKRPMKSDKGARKRGFASGRKKEEKQAAAEQTFVFRAN